MPNAQHMQRRSSRASRYLWIGIPVAIALIVTGCASRTNFSFPTFGLIGKDKKDDTSNDYNPNGPGSGRLIDGPNR